MQRFSTIDMIIYLIWRLLLKKLTEMEKNLEKFIRH